MYRMDAEQQGLTESTENCIQYPMLIIMKRIYRKCNIKADPFPEILLTMLNTEDKEKHPVSI